MLSSEEKSYFENSYSKKSLKINCNLFTLGLLLGVLNDKLNYNILYIFFNFFKSRNKLWLLLVLLQLDKSVERIIGASAGFSSDSGGIRSGLSVELAQSLSDQRIRHRFTNLRPESLPGFEPATDLPTSSASRRRPPATQRRQRRWRRWRRTSWFGRQGCCKTEAQRWVKISIKEVCLGRNMYPVSPGFEPRTHLTAGR